MRREALGAKRGAQGVRGVTSLTLGARTSCHLPARLWRAELKLAVCLVAKRGLSGTCEGER